MAVMLALAGRQKEGDLLAAFSRRSGSRPANSWLCRISRFVRRRRERPAWRSSTTDPWRRPAEFEPVAALVQAWAQGSARNRRKPRMLHYHEEEAHW